MSTFSGNDFTITLDDDPIVAKMIQKSLGIRSLAFQLPQELLKSSFDRDPVACFIDIHLGTEANGLEIVPALREKWPFCPLIVVTSDPTDEAVIEALASGADDFIRKPIRPRELSARLQTRLLDQAQKEAKSVLRIGDVELDRAHRTVRGPSGERYLSDTEVNLFLSLIQARGTIVPRHALKLRCWGQIAVSDNALDRKVYEVRRALKEIGSHIRLGTAYGVGFSMDTEETASSAAV